MFCPAVFREERADVLRALIREHPLGTLVTHGLAGLVANLVPFTLVERDGAPDLLRAHLARANNQLHDLREGGDALVVFQGPQAYVTPSWYPSKQEHGRVVPTWNYIAVQVHGRPQLVEEPGWLRNQLDALTEQQERNRPKPWEVADAPAPFIAGQLRGIVGLEIPVDRITGKWKASQNQPEQNRLGVVTGLRNEQIQPPLADLIEATLPSG